MTLHELQMDVDGQKNEWRMQKADVWGYNYMSYGGGVGCTYMAGAGGWGMSCMQATYKKK